ncbi:MAG: choice-of-anchor D domain-containing protein [Terriglobales bacterium]
MLLFAVAEAESSRHILITQNVDESKLVTLSGNTRPEAVAKYDRGRVADNLQMDHMLLQLRRSPEQEQELQLFIDQLTDKSSPSFHQWLTSQEFGERFGVADQDRDTIKRWLQSHGLKVNVDYTNGMLIDFSGTAAQVRAAFHTEIHQLDERGVKHIANMSDPRVPAALAPAVVGVVSLNNFMPHTLYKPRQNYTVGGGYYLVGPGDMATIYNLNPLFSAGTSGQGQTIVVIEDTDVYSTSDWTTFRSTFGLSSYTSGSFTQVHPAPPSGSNNCSDPGVNGADGEAILDAEYSSAAAPSAAIELASCSDTETTFGGLLALQNLLNESSTPPALVSISYGECEAANGSSANAAYNSTYQQGATEGVSIFVSSGDEGAASCNADESNATYGIGVSGFTSTPYNVSVGGTDFGDTYAGTNSTYWSSTNSSTYESAKSYIPEIPWNDSCASVLIATASGYSETYGTSGFCNSATGEDDYTTTASGSGGPSGCATGSPSIGGVVSGTCAGWAKPSWQSLVGNPSDGVRDIPDVSLFAANGVWGHYYPFCYSDVENGGTACTGAPENWSGAGGTSFASPIMAGIQALVNQKTGARQGNPNSVYYSLAATEYGTSGDSACNSTLGNAVAGSCVFYDVTQGDMDVNCTGSYDCYLPSGSYGVLSTSKSAYDKAYGTQTGWDFATGIGSVNAANLVNNWPASGPSFTLSANPNSVTITQGNSGASTITITPSNGFSGSVTLSASGLPTGVTATFVPNPATTTSTLTLAASASATTGKVTVTIQGVSGALTKTTTVSLTVNASTGAPAVTFTPASLAFGSVVEGETSAAKNVTLKNSGTATLNITGIAASGDFALKTSTKPCGATLAAGKTCTISVTFTPASLGALTGSVTITDNASGSPQTVPLTGTGTAQATLTPATATYAATTVGATSAAKVFTLANKQSVALTSIVIGTTGDFSVSTTTCTTSLAAKASCKISVVFKPAATGALSGSLNVTDSAVGSPQTSSLKGTGK